VGETARRIEEVKVVTIWQRFLPVAALLTLFLQTVPALAAGYPTVPFTCEYSVQTLNSRAPQGAMKVFSDGKGKLRIERGNPKHPSITLVDFVGHKAYSLSLNGKRNLAYERRLPPTPCLFDPFIDCRGALKDLGLKQIDGHPCHGMRVESKMGRWDIWIGQETEYTVENDSSTPFGGSITKLTNLDLKAPASELFELPKDCVIRQSARFQ